MGIGGRRAVTAVAAGLAWALSQLPAAGQELFVCAFYSGAVRRYDGATGTFINVFAAGGGVNGPTFAAFGPDGDLYVSSYNTDQILRYDGATGAFKGVFIDAGEGGLDAPVHFAWRPDGRLYVVNNGNASVLRFDGATGAFIDTFVAPGSGGLVEPRSLAWGPDGNLYISGFNNVGIKRYDGTTGAFLDTFVPYGSGGLTAAQDSTFGPDGNLYVAAFSKNQVLRFDGTTGAFLGVFASGSGLSGPTGLAFGPDGHLYVSGHYSYRIHRFDGVSGAPMGDFVADGGLTSPTRFVFRSALRLSLTPTGLVGGRKATATVSIPSPLPDDLPVALSSSDPTVATVPASVLIPAGQAFQTFKVSTKGVAAATSVDVSATRGIETPRVRLLVKPADLLSLSLTPTSTVGGKSVAGKVTLNGYAPPGGAVVALATTNPAATLPPSGSVTVAQDRASAFFTVRTAPVAAKKTGKVTAAYRSVTKSVTLTVTPPALKSLSLNPSTVPGGSPSTRKVVLTGLAPAGGMAVALATSDGAVAQPVDGAGSPISSVTVPAGQLSASFTVRTQPTGSTSNVLVSITAKLGTVSKSRTLTVTP